MPERLCPSQRVVRRFLMHGPKTSPAFNKWRAQIPDFVRELKEEYALSKQLKLLQASLEASLHVIWVFGLASDIEAHCKRLDCNQRSVHGQTAFCSAVENNQLGNVKALLTHGRCDANEYNVKATNLPALPTARAVPEKRPPIDAAERDRSEMTKIMLEAPFNAH
ncbi:MAG: hypothetical protein Q9197_003280 [Variospora fuerteventurae]